MSKVRCIAVVATPTAVIDSMGHSTAQLLAPYELVKVHSFKSDAARHSYVAAHLVVRLAAAMASGLRIRDLVLGQRCTECGGPHGKPAIQGRPDLHVSLSHSATLVAAVAGPSPNAIDVEDWDNVRFDELRQGQVFSSEEQWAMTNLDSPTQQTDADRAALRLWLRKECLIKLGRLSLDAMSSVDLQALGFDAVVNRGPGCGEHSDLLFTEWDSTHHRASGAVATRESVDVLRYDLQVRRAQLFCDATPTA